eukprot:TRINITY_DN29640_c0_g1_i1.p1 TRINITY_DN29640_c0_g1~~TRINITY_DN29640_c0_g1_i1.p1  ORF type:complete len:588 (+),score=205.23 TRINITY_DN29640_c0_g1_i1:47-1765(+)
MPETARPRTAGTARQPEPPEGARSRPPRLGSSPARASALRQGRTREAKWQREHARVLTAHDEEYVALHGLSEKLSGAWDSCLRQKPSDPLSYLAEKLDPTQTRRAVLELQQELDDARADGLGQHGAAVAPSRRQHRRVRAVHDADVRLVRASFAELLTQPTLLEEVWLELSALAPQAAALLRAHDSAAEDQSVKLLPLLRLATDHLDRLSTVEAFLRGVARGHVSAGVMPRDYGAVSAAVLRVVRRWSRSRADKHANEVKRSWLRLYGFMSTAMAAGAEGVALHPTHRAALEPSAEDVRNVKESLARVPSKAGAATAIARLLIDLSPRAAEVIKKRGSAVPRIGNVLLDAASLIADMLERGGSGAALSYLTELGVKHEEQYGVGRELYPFVGQALLAALDHSLGKEADEEAAELVRAWQRALDLICGILSVPLPEGAPMPTAEVMAVSDLSTETRNTAPDVEADMAAVARGRATPEPEEDDGAAQHGDVSNVPIGDRQLRALFKRYDTRHLNWLSRDQVVRVYMSQESFGLPVTKEKAGKAVDELLRKYSSRQDGRVTFEEFSIVMLQIAQR